MRTRVALPIAAVVLLWGSPTLKAQSPEFEVASIKVNRSGSGGSNLPFLRNGTIAATNVSLLMLLQSAYELSAAEIVGPGWLESDRFDLAGKSPEGVPDSEMKPMLQALLRDRFHLSAHREMREMPSYEMVVAKDGLKISRFDGTHPPAPAHNHAGAMMIGVATMARLARNLTGAAGRPVVDKTGLDGAYSYLLTFSPLSPQSESASDPAAPDFFAAVQQQLGLKLEPKRASLEVLVIDHAERVPTEN
jgi:uncharacterized protein (TIGR03435 family)